MIHSRLFTRQYELVFINKSEGDEKYQEWKLTDKA